MTSNINKNYLDKSSLVKKALAKDSVVQLQEFFSDEKILDTASDLKFSVDNKLMDHKYSSAKSDKISKMINDKEILSFIGSILGKKIRKIDCTILSLGHCDYSLISDSKETEILIDCTHGWNNNHGGGVMFNDGSGNVLKIPAMKNSIIISNGKTFRYIKYVNNHARKDRRILIIGKI